MRSIRTSGRRGRRGKFEKKKGSRFFCFLCVLGCSWLLLLFVCCRSLVLFSSSCLFNSSSKLKPHTSHNHTPPHTPTPRYVFLSLAVCVSVLFASGLSGITQVSYLDTYFVLWLTLCIDASSTYTNKDLKTPSTFWRPSSLHVYLYMYLSPCCQTRTKVLSWITRKIPSSWTHWPPLHAK